MTATIQRVCITGTGAFLPGDPVPNDRIDAVLGPLDAAPPRVQQFVQTVGRRMLDAGGIETRHFAVDPETHELTHTVASLAEVAENFFDRFLPQAREIAKAKPEVAAALEQLLSTPEHDWLRANGAEERARVEAFYKERYGQAIR